MYQSFHSEEQANQFVITGDVQQPFKINRLVETLKPQGNIQFISVIQINQKKAQLEYRFSSGKRGIQKIFVSLIIKHHILQIKCIHILKRLEIKWLDKKLPQIIAKLNDSKNCSTLALTVRYQNQKKSLNIDTFLPLQNLIPISYLQHRVTKAIQQSIAIMKEAQQIITLKKQQCQVKYDQQLIKQQDKIQKNRLLRDKCTKISLYSQYNVPILSKIINDYRLQINQSSLKIRQLYSKFKFHKEMFQKKPEQKQVINITVTPNSSGSSQDPQNKDNPQKKYKNTVLKGILLQNQKVIQDMQPGGFGYITKCLCQFTQLHTFCAQVQQQIEILERQNNQQTSKVYATDTLIKKVPKDSQYARQSFQTQLKYLYMMRDLQCSQIAEYYRVCQVNTFQSNQSQVDVDFFLNSKCLYSKYYEHQLAQFLSKGAEIRLKIMIDLLQGIAFLQKHQVLHRDIKPSNIKLSNRARIKIIDFGSACFSFNCERKNFDQTSKQSHIFGSTPQYTLSYNNRANLASSNISFQQFIRHIYYDVYACGKILQKFFANQSDPPFIQKHVKYIHQKCMEENPYDRITPQEAVRYLKQVLKVYRFISEI